MRPVLHLYVREYCDLCDKVLAELSQLQDKYRFDVRLIDIDADDELEQKYATLIPVAEHEGRILFYYHVDRRALDAAFGAIG